MKKKEPPSNTKSDEYQNFERLAKALLSVPKSELDKRQKEYERARAERLAKKSR